MNRKELVAAVAEDASLEQKTVDAVLRSLQSTLEFLGDTQFKEPAVEDTGKTVDVGQLPRPLGPDDAIGDKPSRQCQEVNRHAVRAVDASRRRSGTSTASSSPTATSSS